MERESDKFKISVLPWRNSHMRVTTKKSRERFLEGESFFSIKGRGEREFKRHNNSLELTGLPRCFRPAAQLNR